MSRDKQYTVFDRFNQVEKSLARNHEDSGIGMSLAESLVEMHKGKISVRSEYGNGARCLLLNFAKTYQSSVITGLQGFGITQQWFILLKLFFLAGE
ncbi:MAG: ATP-binding protein [Clostridiaceae bacterium]